MQKINLQRTLPAMLSGAVVLLVSLVASPLSADAQIRLTEAEGRKAVVQRVEPDFPPIARQLNLSGRVEVDIYVDTTGRVEKVEPVSGNPILSNSAVAAAKRWKFQPVEADGKASAAVVRVAFNFVR